MTDLAAQQPVKIPGPDHPISVEPSKHRVTVSVAGRVIADSADALSLREANYKPVYYIPRKDVDMAQLTRSDHASYCPYKGEAAYYSIPALGGRGANAVWTYEAAYESVSAIAGHVAFYPDRTDIQELPLV